MGTEPQTRRDEAVAEMLDGFPKVRTLIGRGPNVRWAFDILMNAEGYVDDLVQELEQAETELSSLRAEWAEEREVIFSDLRNLLDELGMFSGARPESPHEVMCAAIEEVHKLKQRVPGLPSAPGSLGEDDPGAIEAGRER